ncbi:pkinase-domain-containing protein [Diplodia corticola]|uniref:Pkinase-domain-containing protein n=1 Tax=Diplodia corticola TaxID=236234 RepID=A0A1J9QZE3_9PEZI|nr:pkinase-domain-containing protein [Diplodia corticola]OJD33760.1 pkinase-domain-containing protein [Diplodia corticola]
MDEEPTQPATQQVIDPRRLGRSISGLGDDVADILCILTPTSRAAFQIVENTAKEAPQHVLQNQPINGYQPNTQPFSQSLEEAETFILDPHDLALRFSSSCKQPWHGFCFGRNPSMCDVILPVSPDSAKKISNLHFMIYVNKHGVLMLEDASMNGTLVDDVHLKARTKDPLHQRTKMLQPGSMITLLSTTDDEMIKFIVRIPDHTGFEDEYAENLNNYMANVEEQRLAKGKPARAQNEGLISRRPAVKAVNTFGMHWNGGRIYNVIDILGKGAFATVYKIAKAMDGQLLAAKELEKKRFMKNGHLDQKLDNEMKIMQSLVHPHIVQYIDTHDVGHHLYIIMEYVPYGNLSDLLTGGRCLPEGIVQRMACQIFSCLAYLHSKRITHRDIKPDNILIASESPFDVKLSDFGLSKVVTNNETFLKTFCGTLLYCAPEVFPHYDSRGNKKRRKPGETKKRFHSYSQSVDIWSFGAVLWSSLCGSPPFEGVMDNTGRAMFDRIMETPLDPTPLLDLGVSDHAIDLLTTMLRTDPAQRPTELECLRHPWLAGLAREIVPEIVQSDLNAIPEEDEEDDEVAAKAAETQLSELSLNDRKAGWGLPSQCSDDEDEEYGEEPEPEPINPHQSKRPRVRRDHQPSRYPLRNLSRIESSPEESQNPVVRTSIGINSSMASRLAARGRGQLFGEFGKSTVGKPRTLDDETNPAMAVDDDDSSEGETPDKSPKANQSIKRRSKTPVESQGTPRKDPRGNKSAASLDGAESMVKKLTVHDQFEPHTPHTPTGSVPGTPSPSEIPKNRLNDSTTYGSQEQTPRPTTNTKFTREIKLSPPGSLYYDPYDPSTHNLEYAAMISGKDFVSGRNGSVTSLPSTHFPSDASEQDADEDDKDDVEGGMGGAVHSPPAADPSFRKPSTPLGKLTTTDDSIEKVFIRLDKRVESWGRDPDNTHHFEDNNRLIPRNAFTIWFYSPDINMDALLREGEDWTKIPDLKVAIHTNSRWGITVNNARIDPPKPDGSYSFGHLHTGDVITVFDSGRTKLKFVCEFSVGEAAKRRPEGSNFPVFHTLPKMYWA